MTDKSKSDKTTPASAVELKEDALDEASGGFRPSPTGDGTTEHFFRPSPTGDGTTQHVKIQGKKLGEP